jgi:hypothetical protein
MGIQAVGGASTADIAALYERQSTRTNASKNNTEVQKAALKSGESTLVDIRGGARPAGSPQPAISPRSSSSATGSAKIQDKKDADHDGDVSFNEEQNYAVESPNAGMLNPTTATPAKMQAGLNAYQQGGQGSSNGSRMLLA